MMCYRQATLSWLIFSFAPVLLSKKVFVRYVVENFNNFHEALFDFIVTHSLALRNKAVLWQARDPS